MLPVSAWIAWGLFAIARVVLVAMRPGQLSPYQQGQMIGEIVAMWLLPTIVAWIAWRLAGRSKTAGTAGFFVAFALALFGQLSSAARRASTNEALAGFKTLQEQQQQAQRAAIESGRPLDPKQAEKFVADAAAQLRKAAETGTPEDRAVAEAGKAFTERLLAANRRYNEAAAELRIDSFFQIAPLVDPDRIAERRKRVQAFADANTELQELQANGATLFQKELEKRRVSRENVRRTLAGYEEKAAQKLPLLLKVREIDGQLADTMLQFLDIAEGKEGKWRVEPGGKVVFENSATVTRYNELLQLVDRLGDEQREYQQQLVAPDLATKRK